MATPFELAEDLRNADGHPSEIFEGQLNNDTAVSTILEFMLKMELGTDFLAESDARSTQLKITKTMAEAFLTWHPGLLIAASTFRGTAGGLLGPSEQTFRHDPCDPDSVPLLKRHYIQDAKVIWH
jgi:hypothetical protein